MFKKSFSTRSKRPKNRKGQNRQVKLTLPRQTSLLGVPVKKTIRYNELITSVFGTQNLVCNTSSQNYWNFSSLSTATDFTPFLNTHQMFKISSITVKITRIISESQLSIVFTGGAANLYVACFPIFYTTIIPVNTVNNQESSMTMPPFYNRSISRTFPILNASLARQSGGVSYTVNLHEWCNMANLQYATGEIAVAGVYSNNASVTTGLYEMEISADFTFAVPI
jgi:hypothetical protein